MPERKAAGGQGLLGPLGSGRRGWGFGRAPRPCTLCQADVHHLLGPENAAPALIRPATSCSQRAQQVVHLRGKGSLAAVQAAISTTNPHARRWPAPAPPPAHTLQQRAAAHLGAPSRPHRDLQGARDRQPTRQPLAAAWPQQRPAAAAARRWRSGHSSRRPASSRRRSRSDAWCSCRQWTSLRRTLRPSAR